MSVRLKILQTNSQFLKIKQPGDSSEKDYIFCLNETDCSYIEKLNKGLRSSQSSWFPQHDFSGDSPRDQSTYYNEVGPEFQSGQTGGLNSTPGIHPWRFRSTPASRLNELFWPTQFQRHAEMYVAFTLDTFSANLLMSMRESPAFSSDTSKALGIDRVYILFGPNEVSGGRTDGPYFYMRCAGIHVYNGDPTIETAINGAAIFIMKLVDDRYYWNKIEFDPFLNKSDGYIPTPREYFDYPGGIKPTVSAQKTLEEWNKSYTQLEFTNQDNVNIYNNRNFGFTIYPHSIPPSGLHRGLSSDWVCWTQGYIPIVLPNFSSFPVDNEEGLTGPASAHGYAYFSLSPAFLAEDSLFPRDYDNWLNMYAPSYSQLIKSSNLNHLSGARVNTTSRSKPVSAFRTSKDANPFNRSTWPDVSWRHRNARRSGFLGRIRIDLRENDILYGQRFITSDKFGEYDNSDGGDTPYHMGVFNTASRNYSDRYLKGDLSLYNEVSTPILTVNTALFSNEIIDTSEINADWVFEGDAPPNDTKYDPLAGNTNRENPNLSHADYTSPKHSMLIDAAKRITNQYEYLALLDTGPESREYVDWQTSSLDNTAQGGVRVFTEFDHHSVYYNRPSSPTKAVGSWFFTYESFTFAPTLTAAAYLRQGDVEYSQVTCIGTSFRKDCIPLEMPITWSAPENITFYKQDQTARTIPVTLGYIDNGQQIYVEGNVVDMTGFDNPTYYMKVSKVKPASGLGGKSSSGGTSSFISSPIIRLHKPDGWPNELVPGESITCIRMPEQSNKWWNPQWVPLTPAEGSSTIKQLVRFTLDVALTTSDASQSATITNQYGPGSDNSDTAITVHNLLTSTAGTYVFEGDVGDAGLAMRDADQNYRIIQIECPDTTTPDPDPGGGGDPGGETP